MNNASPSLAPEALLWRQGSLAAIGERGPILDLQRTQRTLQAPH